MMFVPGVLLLFSTLAALIIANSSLKENYNYVINKVILFEDFNIKTVINDFLMAIFFLVVGCEIKKEVLYGYLSDIKKAAFPVIASIGGVVFPALIYIALNMNTTYLNGLGIPISTDIAFAIGAFMLFKNKLDSTLKIFLLSLAVVDDLLSIFMIAIIHSSNLNLYFMLMAFMIIISLLGVMKKYKEDKLYPYLLIGILLWIALYKGGIHQTISGVILAIFIPSKLQKTNYSKNKLPLLDYIIVKISPICNYFILPMFAFANTGISINIGVDISSFNTVIYGIIIGLVLGKPLGIMIFSYLSTKIKIANKPESVNWKSIFVVSVIAGIGFTMSILSAEIAFKNSKEILNVAKMSILAASILSFIVSFIMVNFFFDFRNKEV